jgi:hypothetical protein
VPDGILWVESKHHARWTVSMMHKPIVSHKKEDWNELGKHIFVYTASDLMQIHEEMKALHLVVITFVEYARLLVGRRPGAHESVRDKRYRQLCAEPRIAKELARMRKLKSTP